MYTPVSVMRTPSVLEENDNREWMWLGSEILLRVGRSRSSVRHNSFLWSLAPLRFVLYVKGNIPCTDGRPLRRSASASVVGMSVRTSFGLGGRAVIVKASGSMALANQVFKISWQWLASGFSGSKNSSFQDTAHWGSL